MPKVQGILETALHVKDVRQAADFYQQLFGCSILLDSERLIALNVADRNVLLLFQRGGTSEPVETPGGLIPAHRGTSGEDHLAFAIAAEEFCPWQERLSDLQIRIESTVTWPGGAESLYFRDPDQNLVELMTPGFWAVY